MSLLRYFKLFGSSTDKVLEPTTDGRLNTTPYDSDGNEIFTAAYPAVVGFSNGTVDAFGRARTSEPKTIFDSQLQYNTQTVFFWNQSVSGAGASVTHDEDSSSADLTVGTVSGEKVIRQTKRYIRYQPGKGQFVAMTGVIGSLKSNVRQRVGQFDDDNGLFFEQDGTNLKVVRRTKTSGSAVDNAVNQASWNIDKLDGTGKSGITLDLSKSNIVIIDYQWLGVGRVRMGFDIDGYVHYCHQFLNANNLDDVYMTTANLPLRYEIENTGTAASPTTLRQICACIASEGGFELERGVIHSVNTGTTSINLSAERPVLSVTPKANFGSTGIVNRADVIPQTFGVTAANCLTLYKIIYNGALSSSSSFVDPSTNATFMYDVISTGISGGEVLISGFVPAGSKDTIGVDDDLKDVLALTNSIVGSTGDTLTIVCAPVDGTTGTVNAAMDIKEVY